MAMIRLGGMLGRLLRDESGQDLVEYALVATLVALGAVASVRRVAAGVGTVFASVGSTLTSAT